MTLQKMDDLAEPVFGRDAFRKPRVLKPSEVVCQSVLMVLFGKPGCFPGIPELGMDIRQYRLERFDMIDTDDLLAKLTYQCGLLRQNIMSNSISINKTYAGDKRPCLLITVPVSTESDHNTVVIGISELDGETVYNYKLVDEMLMK